MSSLLQKRMRKKVLGMRTPSHDNISTDTSGSSGVSFVE